MPIEYPPAWDADKRKQIKKIAEAEGEKKIDATAILTRYKNDLIYYANQCLSIIDKNAQLIAFEFNKAQLYIHERIEAQRKRLGYVRVIILKGRQQGCSTYIAARFYHRINFQKGLSVFILSHSRDSTEHLFGMVSRYYTHTPEGMKHRTEVASANELLFAPPMESGYKIGTAGSAEVGRSKTIHLFHGSEVAFWHNAESHLAGIMQAVSAAPGTELILESTANGIGNVFHSTWQSAEAGLTDMEAIFVPWHWQTEYRKKAPPEFKPSFEDAEYARLHKLDIDQIFWMQQKRIELGSEWRFKQEYPATAAEAFQTSGTESFIPPQVVMAAREEKPDMPIDGARLGGVDPARFGDDSTALYFRIGRFAEKYKVVNGLDLMQVVGLCVTFIREKQLEKLFIDTDGIGAGVYDRLKELGYGDVIVSVGGGTKPLNPERYSNKRAENWGLMHDWLKDVPCQIPNLDSLHGDLIGPKYSFDSAGRLVLEKKADMKKRGLRSPDEADALSLTFAYPVANNEVRNSRWNNRPAFADSDYNIFGGD